VALYLLTKFKILSHRIKSQKDYIKKKHEDEIKKIMKIKIKNREELHYLYEQ
jgi:hypothetical protein